MTFAAQVDFGNLSHILNLHVNSVAFSQIIDVINFRIFPLKAFYS